MISIGKEFRTVLKSGGLYIFGNLFNKAIAFITIPIFTDLLSTEEYGIVNTYSSWVMIIAVLVGLSMGQTIRNAYVDHNKELGKYVSSIFALATINLGLFFLLYFLLSNHIHIDRLLVVLCLIEAFSNFVVNSLLMKYVIEEEALRRTALMVFPNLLGAIISVVLIKSLHDNLFYGRVIGTCVSTSLFGVGIVLFYFVKYKSFYKMDYYRYALPLSIPLIFHGLAVNVLGTSDRTIITYYRGASETGIYSLIYNLSMVASVVVSSAESVWIPKMIKCLMKRDYKRVNRDIEIYIYVVTFAFCGLLMIAPEMVVILGGEEYLSGRKMIFPIVAASYVVFIYSIYVNVEYFYKKTKIIAISTFIAAGTNLVLNFLFIPRYGATAAAYTTLFSYFVSMILHYRSAYVIDKNFAPIKGILIYPSIFCTIGCICSICSDNTVNRYVITTCAGVMYLFYGIKKYFRFAKS